MNRSELHAEAIRIHRAMVDAPPGEQVTVLFAALLNFVRPEQTVAKVETLDPAPCLRCCGSGAEPPPGWVGRQPLRIERSADGTLCHTCPWGSTERHADCAACVLEPAAPARPEASIDVAPKCADCYYRGRPCPYHEPSEPAGPADGSDWPKQPPRVAPAPDLSPEAEAELLALCESEPAGNTGPECTDTTRNPSGFCARCGLAH